MLITTKKAPVVHRNSNFFRSLRKQERNIRS